MPDISDSLESVGIDVDIILGVTHMPVHQLLRMGRGAIIELNATEEDDVILLVNQVPFAKGSLQVNQAQISVEVSKMLMRAGVVKAPAFASPAASSAAQLGSASHETAEAAPPPATPPA